MSTPANPDDLTSWLRAQLDEYERAGFTREEYIEDRHAAYLAGMTTWQSLRRWWWVNWPGPVTAGILLAITAVLAWVEYA